ncbi:diacylglycerol/lipid kinase family protein [Rhizosaccharibacter radicis]|uniref:Diacylglycerol kinase family lipid kinase n=1 Tax=Rhizosaccharibacter radicis TaxID=2782605 RepID=A0ABT1VYY5_9PROT|nr:diacylglycerol kinase family lipid kinase [Acetobacteraceae bacterium KSS12]
MFRAHPAAPAPMLVIYNPTAGRRRAARLWRVLDVLVGHGVALELVETTHAGHARALARDAARRGAELVVAAGGDGTVAEVTDGLGAGATRLGIIPIGTANVLAHELRLPTDPGSVAAALIGGRTRTLWPGRLSGPGGERLFVQMLGVGFDAQVVHHVSGPVKRALGRGAYVAQTLRELPRYRFAAIHVRLDGRERSAGSVIVSKGCLYGGPYRLAPDAVPDSPGFSVALFAEGGIGQALLAGMALPLNLLPRLPGLRIERAHRVELMGDQDLPAQADGDPAGTTPLRIDDAPGPVAVMVGR